MIRLVKSTIRKALRKTRQFSHGEMIQRLLRQRKDLLRANPVFVETGSGLSTVSLSTMAKELDASAYSLDYNAEKINDVISRFGDQVGNIEFVIGDSLENLTKIVERHTIIDFLSLDSAPSAMHTFREFLVAEPAFKPGSCLLVDNAALPGEKKLLSPVRKGKILVPYLLASPYWDVHAHPRSGDSMIFAVLHNETDFADPDYERSELYLAEDVLYKMRFSKIMPSWLRKFLLT